MFCIVLLLLSELFLLAAVVVVFIKQRREEKLWKRMLEHDRLVRDMDVEIKFLKKDDEQRTEE